MPGAARVRYKKIAAFVEEVCEAFAQRGLRPQRAKVRVRADSAIDKDGGFNVGAKADIADVTALSGVPVGVEAGVESKWDAQGRSDLELEVEFEREGGAAGAPPQD